MMLSMLDSDISDGESTWGMNTDEEEQRDCMLIENEYEVPDER